MELTVTGLSVGENNDLVMLGKMGVWEAKIYFGPSEMKQVMRLALKPDILGYVMKLPFMQDKKQ